MGIIGKGSLVNQKEVKSDFDEVSKAYDKMLKDMISTAEKVKESGSLTDLMQVDKEAQQNLKKLTTLQNKVVQLEKKLADALKKNNTQRGKNNKKTAEARKLITQLNRARQKASLIDSKRNKELQETNALIAKQNAAMRRNVAGGNSLLNSFKKLTLSLKNLAVAYLGFQTLIRGVKDIFQLTKTLDSIDFAQRKVIKSQLELAETQEFLSRLADDYGSDLVAMSERYIKFRAATNSSNLTAKETQQIFESVTKASATLGLKTDELRGVYLALEQMISKNKVTTEELRRQLGERLPGAFDIMARSMGVSTEKLNDMLKAGEVMSEEVLPNFAKEIERAYGIENVKRVDTLVAAQNRLRTAWIELVDALKAGDTFKNFFNTLASGVKWLKENISSIKNLLSAILSLAVGYTTFKGTMILVNALMKISNVSTVRQISLTITAKAALDRLTQAQIRYNAALKANQIGLIIGAITTVITLFSLYGRKTKEAEESQKSFDDQIRQSKSDLEILINSLKNAEKNTREWSDAKKEINSVYGEYLDNLITETTTAEELEDVLSNLIKIERENIAIKEKKRKASAITKEADKEEVGILEDLNKEINNLNVSQREAGKITAQFFDVVQNKGNVNLDKFYNNFKKVDGAGTRVFRLVLKLSGVYEKQSRRLQELNEFYNGFISASRETSEAFDTSKFQKGLDSAQSAFTGFAKRTSKDTRKLFSDNNKITLDSFNEQGKIISDSYKVIDFKNYENFLKQLLIKYRDNVKARSLIEAELFELNKGGTNNALRIQEEIDKKKLEQAKKALEEEFALQVKSRRERGDSELEINQFIEDQDRNNKLALLETEKGLLFNRLSLVKSGSIDYLKIMSDISKLDTEIAKERTDKQIGETKRLFDERERIAKQSQTQEQQNANDLILLTQKRTSDDLENELNRYRLGEISAKRYAKNVEDIERDLQDKILQIQFESLKKQLQIQNLRPDEYERIAEQITQIQERQQEKRREKSKESGELLIEQRREVRDASIELINELFSAQNSALEYQLQRAQDAKDFQVALAGSNAEERIKAERKFEKEERKIKQKQAINQKAQQAFNIITNTATGITAALAQFPPNIPLSILIGGIGAIQLATVLATPIPKFAEGTDRTKGGLAIVGDKKGDTSLRKKGGSELITLPSGKSFLSPDSSTLMNLPKGSIVKSHSETQKILANAAMNTAYERIDMGKSEGYLKDIRDKENTTYFNGYKIVKRKGFTGRYATR